MAAETDTFRDLLDRWEELHESGQEPDVDELCRECPQFALQLRDWVRMLSISDWLNQPAEIAASDTRGAVNELTVADRQKPSILGEYELLEQLGDGGMGQVFRARHRQLHREVALKVLPRTASQSHESIQRFQREGQVLARLSHPNIVTVHDAGAADGTLFFVMDLVSGKDLSRLVRENGPLSWQQAIESVLQTAHGLAYAHAAGIIHRDIKPSNLILDSQNCVRILDLGIARVAEKEEAAADLTKTGSILGTVDYMAPEQAVSTRKADQRSDIYSLGCTLYFLLTGRPVYGGETVMERLVSHREHPQPSLRQACPAAPVWLDQVFQRMIAKRPEDRLQTMAEVISALEQKSVPRRGRRRWITVVIALVVVALGITGMMMMNSASPISNVSHTWRMTDQSPLIAGVWKQWDGIVLNITQVGAHFSADCTFGQPDVTVHWRADGTISGDGKITAQLVHTDPPRPQPAKPEICTAQLQPDGSTIRGRAAWTNGGDDFIWRLQTPKSADQQVP